MKKLLWKGGKKALCFVYDKITRQLICYDIICIGRFMDHIISGMEGILGEFGNLKVRDMYRQENINILYLILQVMIILKKMAYC